MEHVPVSLSQRRVVRVRHELKRRSAVVRQVQRLGPGVLEITFASEDFADFVSLSFDDHVKFLVEDQTGALVGRDYTPRRFDTARRELVIEFALHGDGPATRWARGAAVGQPVVIGGPRGSMVIATDHDWHLLVGDASALPAVHRRLEELPPSTRAVVVLDVPPAERRPLTSRAALDMRWVDGAEALLAAVRGLMLPPGEGFAWAAGEASVMARLRQLLGTDLGLPKEAMQVAAYWKRGAPAHHEDLAD